MKSSINSFATKFFGKISFSFVMANKCNIQSYLQMQYFPKRDKNEIQQNINVFTQEWWGYFITFAYLCSAHFSLDISYQRYRTLNRFSNFSSQARQVESMFISNTVIIVEVHRTYFKQLKRPLQIETWQAQQKRQSRKAQWERQTLQSSRLGFLPWHCHTIFILLFFILKFICFCIYKMGEIVVSPLQICGKD